MNKGFKQLFKKKQTPTLYNSKYVDFSKQDIMVDVGANIGNTTAVLHKLNQNATFYCFEPYGKAFNQLKENTRGVSKIVTIKEALSNFKGQTTLHVNSYEETNSLLAANLLDDEIDNFTKNISTELVEVNTLDAFVQSFNLAAIDFLKVDVQGGTYEVLEGAKALLSAKRIKILYVEVEFVQIYKEQKLFSEIEMLLRSFDYRFVAFFNINYIKGGQIAWADALFFANNEQVV